MQTTFDVGTYEDRTVRVPFEGVEGSLVAASFLLDDVSPETH